MRLSYMSKNSGASAVEFALIVPVVLLLLFLIIEYGWYFTNKIVLMNAVSTAARSAVQAREWEGEQPETFALYAVKETFWLSQMNEDRVSSRIISSDDYAPRRVEVRVDAYPFRQITGYIPSLMIPGSLSAKAVMVFP